VQQASKRGAPKGSWLERMLTRKPRMRDGCACEQDGPVVWALLVKRELQGCGLSQGLILVGLRSSEMSSVEGGMA
jgi:hypothetical protein